ncbi:hypothetical protein BCV71DRAFT_99285 [Rhizopus microsporus]|uniref:Uncharacterized protein n=1 Tax=Rhizopus microsporus TaxID=58291 RepID=A0A1X0S5P5_RHIZD|nr:hypothetical protein BCV71DRAFT_99285 [Rhizopus microsporus]
MSKVSRILDYHPVYPCLCLDQDRVILVYWSILNFVSLKITILVVELLFLTSQWIR